ncbi:MAG: DUF2368 domain-containing protein [Sphingobacteriia bacterium]|nr:MAG: DUF2368 domain-containing protein [Sphingobacteriia bacterium]
MNNDQNRDEALWETAKARVGFRWSLASYIIVNAFLVGIWFFTSRDYGHFWPIWPILGWGIGIGFQYARAYHGNSVSSVEEEYQKLKNKS